MPGAIHELDNNQPPVGLNRAPQLTGSNEIAAFR